MNPPTQGKSAPVEYRYYYWYQLISTLRRTTRPQLLVETVGRINSSFFLRSYRFLFPLFQDSYNSCGMVMTESGKPSLTYLSLCYSVRTIFDKVLHHVKNEIRRAAMSDASLLLCVCIGMYLQHKTCARGHT